MITITSKRIRNIVSECKAERELVSLLRHHKIRFSWTEGEMKVPTRKGAIRISRSRSRFEIHGPAPVPYNPNHI